MQLAVAGLDRETIHDDCRSLAGGDWSRFSAAERTAFALARKQAADPASLTARDVQQLTDCFGPEGAVDVLWWMCRCHYMTRVADAFQLPLEADNVFDGFRPVQGVTRKP